MPGWLRHAFEGIGLVHWRFLYEDFRWDGFHGILARLLDRDIIASARLRPKNLADESPVARRGPVCRSTCRVRDEPGHRSQRSRAGTGRFHKWQVVKRNRRLDR